MEAGMSCTNLLYDKLNSINIGIRLIIFNAIIIIIFVMFISDKSQACCYLAGYTFYYGVSVCSTAEECVEPALRNGCTVTQTRPGGYMISCNGYTSGCGVDSSINCCAIYPDSIGCIGSYLNPCFYTPDDPSCNNPKCDDPNICGNNTAQAGNP
jgi:hypothetical protein